MKRSCLRLAVSLVVLSFYLPSTAAAQSAKPNIIVVMIDDVDAKMIDTLDGLSFAPNIRKYFIEGGTTFTNAFVSNSECCPSRATFLTGQYSHNNGVLNNDFGPTGGVTAFDDRSTLGTWLQGGGYHTGFIGKYLNGYGYVDLDADTRVTLRDITYVPPGWSDWQGLSVGTYTMYNYLINDNGRLRRYKFDPSEYQTDVLADRMVTFLQTAGQPARQGVPFFLVMNPVAPHVELFWWPPLQKPSQWDVRPAPRHEGTVTVPLPRPWSFNEMDISDKPDWIKQYRALAQDDIAGLTRLYRHRLESMRSIDDMIGRLFDTLEATGQLDRTIVFLTSDNGYLHGEHRMSEKAVAYEEAIRVPLYVRVPGIRGQTRSQLVINTDLAPTIADLAGVIPGLTVDGTSFDPLLSRDLFPWRQRFLVSHWAYSTGQYVTAPTFNGVRQLTAKTDRLWIEYEDPAQTPELYDMTIDPAQLYSLHNSILPWYIQAKIALINWTNALKSCQGLGCHVLEFVP